MRVHTPQSARSLAAGGVILLAALAGCRGRAEFHRGAEHYRLGEYRDAYYHYWEAHRLGPSDARRDALRLAGRSVAREEGARARAAEAAGDLEGALEAFALALEYDPDAPRLITGYSRVRGLLERWGALERDLEAARRGPPEDDPFRELEILRAMAGHPRFSAAWRDDLALAARRAAARATGALRVLTFEDPLPGEEEALDRLERGWLDALGRITTEAAREAEAEDSADVPSLREAASWGVVREALAGPAADALAAFERIRAAREGIAWHGKGMALEMEGDLAGAIDAFERAALRHEALTGPVEGAVRVRRRLAEGLHREAAAAVRAGEWRRAAASLDLLLRHDPEDREALSLLGKCRREVAAAHAEEARRLEEAGLPWNALVRWHLALGWDPARVGARAAVRRLETALDERLYPRWRVSFRHEDAADRRARRDLWGVGEVALIRLERTLVESVEAALNAPFDRGPGRESVFTIEDLDFSFLPAGRSPGSETARFVVSVASVENPDIARARAEVGMARERLAAAASRARSAPLRKAALAASLARIASIRCAQAEAALEALPALVPAVAWGVASHATVVEETRAELASRYRAGGESRWAAVSLEMRDRVVAGDPARGIPPDPEEIPSRAEAVRVLGERLAARIARDVPELLLVEYERYYHDALAHLGARSPARAIESLVAFLRSRRGRQDRLADDAARKLEDLTGCDLPAAWKEACDPAG